MPSQITINKQHYNAIVLIASFANRLYFKSKLENELINSSDEQNTMFVDQLSSLLQTVKKNGQLSKEEKLKVFEIHHNLVEDFQSFFKLAPISQIDRVSALYACFLAEKNLHEELVLLNMLTNSYANKNTKAQIAFLDEQLAYLKKAIAQIKNGDTVSQTTMLNINRWYQNLLSFKQQLFSTLSSVHLLLIEQ